MHISWNTYGLGMYWVKQSACYFACLVGQSCVQEHWGLNHSVLLFFCKAVTLPVCIQLLKASSFGAQLKNCYSASCSPSCASDYPSLKKGYHPSLHSAKTVSKLSLCFFRFVSVPPCFVTCRFYKHTSYSSILAVSEDIGQDQEWSGYVRNVSSSFLWFWQ